MIGNMNLAVTIMVLSMAVSSSAFLLAAPLFLTSTLAGAALASTDPADPFSNLLDNLAQAASDYVVFKQAVDSFNGDRNTIRSLAEFGLIVEQSVNNSTATAKACHKLNANESTEVMTALAKPYPTFMADLLGNITAKVCVSSEKGASRRRIEHQLTRCIRNLMSTSFV